VSARDNRGAAFPALLVAASMVPIHHFADVGHGDASPAATLSGCSAGFLNNSRASAIGVLQSRWAQICCPVELKPREWIVAFAVIGVTSIMAN
jgi:hypothetical protein